MFTRSKTIEQLEKAIAAASSKDVLGCWSVVPSMDNKDKAAVGLSFTIESALLPLDFDGSEPWEKWGGNKILAAAGLTNFDGIADTYTDKYGDSVYSDVALIAVTEHTANAQFLVKNGIVYARLVTPTALKEVQASTLAVDDAFNARFPRVLVNTDTYKVSSAKKYQDWEGDDYAKQLGGGRLDDYLIV